MTSLPLTDGPQVATRALSPGERAGQRVVRTLLSRVRAGRLTLRDGADTFSAGTGENGPIVSLTVTDPAFYAAILREGPVGVAESYIDGHWTCDDLAGLFELLLINRDAAQSVDTPMSRLLAAIARTLNTLRRNTRRGSRRNISSHYDLSNEFFALWLDPTMLYSSAFFDRPGMTLEEAQLAKVDRCCTKLDLRPTDHLLEIGTGWGGAAIRAAEKFGCRITTTTISKRQHELATRRVRDRGLNDRVSVVMLDYRDLDHTFGAGTFDKVLSIEMIEAVGHEYLPAYFKAISRLLKPDGLAMVQGIWIRDQRYDAARRTVDFLKRHIFPGSCLIGLSAVTRALRDHTDLTLIHMDDLAAHYVRTLRLWNDAFHRSLDDVRALGFDERFIRTWRYYFEYCEGAFRARHCGDYQMVLAKPLARPTLNAPPQ
jgi:cyclopropane-fatty-acyl-phospholipid synthase